MFANSDEMWSFIEDTNVEQIDFKAIDLIGRWRHITFSTRHATKTLLEKGSGISLSPYPGYRQVHQGDMVARPDPTTAFVDPFHSRRTISVICDLFYPEGKPYERNPRDIVRRAEERIAASGIEGESRWLPEMEFYILDGARYGNVVNTAFYEVASATGSWDLEGDGTVNQLPDAGQGQADAPRDRHAELRGLMVKRIEDAGYPVKYSHHELGGAGQCEIEPLFNGILAAADSIMVMKYMIHNTAREYDMTTTFMPKPMQGAPGNGMHFHQFLAKDGKSLFYDPKGYACMNDMATHYVGGLCRHTPALMGLGCASTNSYRRFGVGLAAPMNLFFSESNRSSSIRIPAYDKTPEGERVEYRLPDATCNPYLTIAAQLLAGLDGINQKIDPTAEGYGPFDVNNYEMSVEERAKIKSGPTEFTESLLALREDNGFLTAGDVFPTEIIDVWIELKLKELDDLRSRPHPYEYELYFDLEIMVRTGLESLLAHPQRWLRGERVALVANATTVDSSLRHAVELLFAHADIDLKLVLAPEHGLHGAAQDMEAVADARDPLTGVPVVSLYGSSVETLGPSDQQLAGIDVMVFDIQDIGARYYTYAATMALCMRAAARSGKRVVVLDRPNPIGGVEVEGGGIDSGLESFVGLYPVPQRHGMTVGELARLYNTTFAIGCELEVVPCEGWYRHELFDQTELPWVMPSPNMPTLDTALVYPGMCLLEGTNFSEGRGTTRPFELFGAPSIDGRALARDLTSMALPGARFRPCEFKPMFHKYAGRVCGGVQLVVSDREPFLPYRTGLAVLVAARRLYPEKFAWRTEVYEFRADVPAIDLLTGSARVRGAIDGGEALDTVADIASQGAEKYEAGREAALLY